MALLFKQVKPESLKDDLSNIADVSAYVLRQELAGIRSEEVRSRLREEVLRVGQCGDGVDFESISTPYQQSGLECQTMAIINGIRSVGGGEYLEVFGDNIADIVECIRERVRQVGLKGEVGSLEVQTGSAISSDAHFAMGSVARQFPNMGIPLNTITDEENPIKQVKSLFNPMRFMGVVESDRFHATSVIPLRGASGNRFAVGLDSLSPRKNVLSVDDFIAMSEKKSYRDNHHIFEIGK